MHRTFETPGHVTVVVENEIGRVDVTCRETAVTEVTVEPMSTAAPGVIDQLLVECSPSGDGHIVAVRVPRRRRKGFHRHGGVLVRVVMPLEGDVDVSTATADIALSGRVGRATLKTASGSIVGEDAAGSVRARSASGNVTFGAIAGEARVQSVSGEVRLGAATDHVVAATTSGDIAIEAAQRAEVRSTSGDVVIRALNGDGTVATVSGRVAVSSRGPGRVRLRSVSGGVSVGIAEGLSLQVDVRAVSGFVRSDIEIGDDGPDPSRVPDLDLEARTVSGDVSIERIAVGAA
jgi:hypothetical protein